MATHDLLFELGAEEIPARFLVNREEEFKNILINLCREFYFDYSNIDIFLTPRRISFIIKELHERQRKEEVEKKGPPASSGLDKNNKPTKSAIAFAKSNNRNPDEIYIKDTDKGKYIFIKVDVGGGLIKDVLADFFKKWILALEFPKKMRWEDSDFEFARPIRWIVAMYASEIITFEISRVKASNITMGPRYYGKKSFEITDAALYELILEDNGIIVSHIKRRKKIRELIEGICNKKGNKFVEDNELIDEINFLVENPVIILCDISEEFMDLPEEVLIVAMKHHQRFIPLCNHDNTISKYFIVFSNTLQDTEGYIKRGNERVLKARLNDAKFFYTEDIKKKLIDYRDGLKNMVFLTTRGSLYDKEERIKKIAMEIQKMINYHSPQKIQRASYLCKNDLITHMVFEFPELQGVMGTIYARKSGEDDEVAISIKEHYLPRQTDDRIPESLLGKIISIADKIDTIICAFSSNNIPTGAGDPIGVRRAMIGIIRILDEGNLSIPIKELFKKSVSIVRENFNFNEEEVLSQISQFFIERIRTYWSDRIGLPVDVVSAGVELEFDYLNDLHNRIAAIKRFRDVGDFLSIAISFKRVINIQRGIEDITGKVDESLFIEETEKILYNETLKLKEVSQRLMKNKNYYDLLIEISKIKPVVDKFFDDVLVMTDDIKLQKNRLNLLYKLASIFLSIIDFSKIQTD
ncbi:MAG: glycine--tRNA ligase subunit beta [Candidatus Hydrogenedentota bacterium]